MPKRENIGPKGAAGVRELLRERRKAEVRRRTDEILNFLHTMRYCPCEIGSWELRGSVRRGRLSSFLAALVTEVGDMQVARRLPHRPLSPPVVASSRRRVGVAGELLHRREVAYGVQQVAYEGLAEVVG